MWISIFKDLFKSREQLQKEREQRLAHYALILVNLDDHIKTLEDSNSTDPLVLSAITKLREFYHNRIQAYKIVFAINEENKRVDSYLDMLRKC